MTAPAPPKKSCFFWWLEAVKEAVKRDRPAQPVTRRARLLPFVVMTITGGRVRDRYLGVFFPTRTARHRTIHWRHHLHTLAGLDRGTSNLWTTRDNRAEAGTGRKSRPKQSLGRPPSCRPKAAGQASPPLTGEEAKCEDQLLQNAGVVSGRV